MLNSKDSTAMKARLARIEGQLRGLQRMISEEDADCEKIAQQMTAARKALDKAAHTMLACMVQQQLDDGGAGEVLDIEKLISKYA